MREAAMAVLVAGCASAAPEREFVGVSDDGVGYVLVFDEPPAVGFAEGTVGVDVDGTPVLDGVLTLDADMGAHGHGPADPAEVEPLGAGRYDVRLAFPMAGTWTLTLRLDGAHPWTTDVVVD